MPRSFIRARISLCALVLASVSSASGAVLYEGFSYNPGALLGSTNPSTGNNWLRAGTSTGPTAINVVNGSLSGPTGFPSSAGNSLALTGIGDGSGSSERLALSGGVNSGTVYYSMLLRG